MRIFKAIVFTAVVALAFFGGYLYKGRLERAPGSAQKGGRRILYYVDPMHPAYKSDKPGIAPDCGMKLEPVYADQGGAEQAAVTAESKGKVLYYRDPQVPDYKSDKPGLNPETGNELVPVYENDPSTFVPGTVQINPQKQQLIGVKYGVVETTGGTETIRAVGKVSYDETRIAHVHTKYEGWIAKVYVDFAGKLVEKGQPLLTIYSPELLASQRELLLAAKAREIMKQSPLAPAIGQSNSLFEAAKQRLALWDVTEEQIGEVLRTGQPIKNVTLYSPISGYVLDRKAFPQVKVMPDTDLYTLVDLSRVWIMADVFEYEAPEVRPGQVARVSMPYSPGRSFAARVNYIQPQVDPMTRTLKVRLDADNPGLALKPDMYVDVTFRVDRPAAITVPADAVLDAGDRKTVFVDRGNGYFEPRPVETGDAIGDRVAILKGLRPGERIVISGTFLIDSESQMKAAAQGMAPGGHEHAQSPATGEKPAAAESPAPSRGGAHQHD